MCPFFDEILYHYPSITLSDIYAALAYYHDHRDEIRSAIKADEEFARQLQTETPSLLQQKLKNRQHG
ncbi:MAG: DUF433 domain-containing protein [Planktothrix sp.]